MQRTRLLGRGGGWDMMSTGVIGNFQRSPRVVRKTTNARGDFNPKEDILKCKRNGGLLHIGERKKRRTGLSRKSSV